MITANIFKYKLLSITLSKTARILGLQGCLEESCVFILLGSGFEVVGEDPGRILLFVRSDQESPCLELGKRCPKKGCSLLSSATPYSLHPWGNPGLTARNCKTFSKDLSSLWQILERKEPFTSFWWLFWHRKDTLHVHNLKIFENLRRTICCQVKISHNHHSKPE